MKKLMIAAAVVLVATFANAGAYVWGFNSTADIIPGGETDVDYVDHGTAMLFLGTIAQTSTGEGSGIDAKYNLDFSGLTQIATAGYDAATYTFGVPEFDSSVTSDSITTDTQQAFTLILFEEDSVTDYEKYEGYYAVYTGTSTLAMDPASSTKYADFTTSDPVLGASWRTAELASADPMPEPTSGLLMLVGLAGLALRRKRA